MGWLICWLSEVQVHRDFLINLEVNTEGHSELCSDFGLCMRSFLHECRPTHITNTVVWSWSCWPVRSYWVCFFLCVCVCVCWLQYRKCAQIVILLVAVFDVFDLPKPNKNSPWNSAWNKAIYKVKRKCHSAKLNWDDTSEIMNKKCKA